MRRSVYLILTFLPLVGVGCIRRPGVLSDVPTAAADRAARERQATLRESARERAEAATMALHALRRRVETHEAFTPEFVESIFEWSRRLRDAEADAADSQAGRVAAAWRHLDLCYAFCQWEFENTCEPGAYRQAIFAYAPAEARDAVIRAGGDAHARPESLAMSRPTDPLAALSQIESRTIPGARRVPRPW
jgi:hypothetical protein